jgi:hypothetical protein
MSGGFCPGCGAQRTGARFCPTCGNDFWRTAAGLAPPDGHEVSAQSAPTPPEGGVRAGRSWLLPAVIVGIVVVAGFGGWIYLSGVSNRILSNVGAALSPSITEQATPTLAPLAGSGKITFGIGLDETTLEVTQPRSTFKLGSKIAFSAELSEPAGATKLDVIIASVSSSGAEAVVYTETVSVSNPDDDVFGLKGFDISALVNEKPGKYVMRYFRASTKLAEGTLTLAK